MCQVSVHIFSKSEVEIYNLHQLYSVHFFQKSALIKKKDLVYIMHRLLW